MAVGFIGLGLMGLPMSRQLLQAGHHLTVHNRSRGKVDQLAAEGAHPASSAAEVTRSSDFVLTCLPDVPTVEQVFLGEGGIIAEARPGQILVDHSTVGPDTSKAIFAAAAAKGASFLDAPISGGVERAADGTLTIMAGGGGRCRGLRPSVARLRSLWGQHTACWSAVVWQHHKAHQSASVRDPFPGGGGSHAGRHPRRSGPSNPAGYPEHKLGKQLHAFPQRPGHDGAGLRECPSPLRLYVKDLGLVDKFAQDMGVPAPLTSQASRALHEAFDRGMGDLDVSSLIIPLKEQAGVQMPKRTPSSG